MGKRWVTLLATVVLTVSIAGSNLVPSGQTQAFDRVHELPEQVRRALVLATHDGVDVLNMQLLFAAGQDMANGLQELASLGATVVAHQGEWVSARVPTTRVADLPRRFALAGLEPAGAIKVEAAARDRFTSATDAAAGVRHGQDVTGAVDFRSVSGATGAGVTIAIIDTGVDPGHPALQQTVGGAPKIVDWRDFTEDGRITTEKVTDTKSAEVKTSLGAAQVGTIRSAGGLFRVGRWYEGDEIDLNHNGSKVDSFGVLLVDSKQPGVYDTVYVTPLLQGRMDFAASQPLGSFATTHAYGQVGPNLVVGGLERKTNFVVADLDPAGTYVQLGYDGVGHGTHVASLAAGQTPGGYTGYAPGSTIMALKVVDSQGRGSTDQVERAVLYAVNHGAQVINLSLSSDGVPDYGSTLGQLLDRVVRQNKVTVVMAAGNQGPGISSAAPPAASANVITVGAYYDGELARGGYGYGLTSEGLLPFSGMGPAADGSAAPDLVAPGLLPAGVPGWLSAKAYGWMEGTSQASPCVAGAVALLLDAARINGKTVDGQSVRRALVMGSRKIEGYLPVEQGSGLLNVMAAWQHLDQINTKPQVEALGPARGTGGMLIRNSTVAREEFTVVNRGTGPVRVNLFANQPWLHLEEQSLSLPPGVERKLGVDLDPLAPAGMATGSIVVHNPGAYGDDLNLVTTVIKPNLFPGDGVLTAEGSVQIGRVYRYFFQVPDGAGRLRVNTSIPVSQGSSAGQLQAVLTRPDGRMVYRSEPFGVGTGRRSGDVTLSDPMAGVWELAVFVPLGAPDLTPVQQTPLSARVELGQIIWPSLHPVLEPGATLDTTLAVTNRLQGFGGRLVVYGLNELEDAPYQVVDHLGIPDRFTLNYYTPALRLWAQMTTAGDLRLKLYRLTRTGDIQLVAASSPDSWGGQVVQATQLQPADYFVVVEAPDVAGPILYQYRRQLAREQQLDIARDRSLRHELGTSWNVALHLVAPTRPGRYYAQVAVMDDGGAVLGWHTIPVDVGLPKLQVQALDSSLVQGETGTVTLVVTDDSFRPVSGTIEVDGVRYHLENGRARVRVRADQPTRALSVRGDITGYSYLDTTVTVAAYPSFLGSPAGTTPGQERSDWRRKLMNEVSQWGQSP